MTWARSRRDPPGRRGAALEFAAIGRRNWRAGRKPPRTPEAKARASEVAKLIVENAVLTPPEQLKGIAGSAGRWAL